eukprot:9290720-Karenia_brevis.AAC.1
MQHCGARRATPSVSMQWQLTSRWMPNLLQKNLLRDAAGARRRTECSSSNIQQQKNTRKNTSYGIILGSCGAHVGIICQIQLGVIFFDKLGNGFGSCGGHGWIIW